MLGNTPPSFHLLNAFGSAFVDSHAPTATPTFYLARHQSPTLSFSDDHGEWHPVKPALLEYGKWDDGMEWWNGGKFTAEVVILKLVLNFLNGQPCDFIYRMGMFLCSRKYFD